MSTPLASSEITSRPHLVEYTSRFVQPPSALYLDPDDSLFVSLATSDADFTTEIGLRILSPDGEVKFWQQDVETPIAKTPADRSFTLMEGFLLGLIVRGSSGFLNDSWGYATIGLTRREDALADVSQLLCRGYYDAQLPLLWPGSPNEKTRDGVGKTRVVTGADPAAGANFSFNVPAGAEWQLRALEATLVTSAAVGNRRFVLDVFRGATLLFSTAAAVVQAASLTHSYMVGHWGESGDNRNGKILVNWPDGLRLYNGDSIVSDVEGIAGGDDFDAPTITVEEWFNNG